VRRALAALTLLLAGLSAPASAAGPRLSEAAGARFPDRAYALTLPKVMSLSAADVHVTENGRPVPGVTVRQATGADARRFGVVLAIDTSGSMHGRPLASALRSARAFVRDRDPAQPVAVIAFGADVRVASDFTTDPAAIESALASVEGTSGRGSRIYDAAARAVDLIRAAKMASGSAVVLSDGADRLSQTTSGEVAAAAKAAGARVYTIGVHSGGTNFGALNVIAATTQGEFSAATSLSDLARVYERLGSRLAHQYLIQYHSPAGPARRVRVAVDVTGLDGTAETGYITPALATAHRPPYSPSPAETVWLRPGAALAIAMAVAALLVLALWLLLRPRGTSLRRRMAPYVGEEESKEDAARRAAFLSGKMRQGAGRSLEQARWWPAFVEKLDIGRVRVAPQKLLTWVAVVTLVTLALLALVTGSPLIALLALGIPLIARSLLERRVAKQRKLFIEQLPDNLQVMASAMRAGHSFSGALSVVVADAPEPTRSEMARVVADERLGVPTDVALEGVVRRMDSKDLEQVALVATLQRETGGNTAEVLERVTETIRERLALRRTVQTLTAQGRMSRWVLTAIPVVLLLVITLVNPAYVSPLYTTPVGKALLGVAAAMVCMGSLVIKKIVDIKV